MRDFVLGLLAPVESSVSIELFNFWHFAYIILIVGGTVLGGIYMAHHARPVQAHILRSLAWLIPSCYIMDLFLMPLANSDFAIDVDKLPFHICTLMAFFVPFAQFNKRFPPVRDTIATLTLVASLMYICYPGSAIGDIAPWDYRVIQTFAYHGLMFAWGTLSLTSGAIKLSFRKLWKCAVGILMIICWANLGNTLYTRPDKHYDWFFITGSTFPFIPAPLMPLVVFVAVFAMCTIITAIYYWVETALRRKAEVKANATA
jgi:hypothetical protein